MKIGMMWFDNNPKTTLAEKVSEAAAYYRKKYKIVADVCMVNPKAVVASAEAPGIRVQTMRAILPGCLWIGVDE